MITPPTVFITKERPVHTYAELWHASDCVLKAGLKNPEGSTWQFLSSIVLVAFAFEAYLNHIGPAHVATWPESQRRSPWNKFIKISATLAVEFPLGIDERPLRTIHELFEFRNSLAHGRSDVLTEEYEREAPHGLESIDKDLGIRPKTDWETLVEDSTFAQTARADVEEVIRALHSGRGETKDILFNSGIGHHSARLQSAP